MEMNRLQFKQCVLQCRHSLRHADPRLVTLRQATLRRNKVMLRQATAHPTAHLKLNGKQSFLKRKNTRVILLYTVMQFNVKKTVTKHNLIIYSAKILGLMQSFGFQVVEVLN
jgi:hypothetical protein